MTRFPYARAVLFDLDGTLVETMGDFADVAGRLMAGVHGGTIEDARADYLRTSGIPFFQQLEVLFPDDPRNADLAERFEREKLVAYEGRHLLPDVALTVEGLRRRGIRSVVSSNNFTNVVEDFLAGEDVRFDLVLGFGDDMHKGEPHFEAVEQAFDLARPALAFVGDSVRDAQLALAGRVPFAARLGTVPVSAFEDAFGPTPFPMLERLDELLTLVA